MQQHIENGPVSNTKEKKNAERANGVAKPGMTQAITIKQHNNTSQSHTDILYIYIYVEQHGFDCITVICCRISMLFLYIVSSEYCIVLEAGLHVFIFTKKIDAA